MPGHIDKIKTPEQLWKDFESYAEFAKRHPFPQHGFFGKDAFSDYIKKERPLSMWGFKLYCSKACGVSGRTVMDYLNNKDGRYPEFKDVAERIRDSIAADQVEGAAAGVYDGRIVSRLNGLVEKSETNVNAQVRSDIDLSKLDPEELNAILAIQKKLNGTDPGD